LIAQLLFDLFFFLLEAQALILSAWGKLDEAVTLHQKEEKIFEELGDQAGLSISYGNQAVILRDKGKLDEAMSLQQKEEKIKKELGDQAGLLRCFWNQGLLLQKRKEHGLALEKLEASLTLQKQFRDPRLTENQKYVQNYRQFLRARTRGGGDV